MSETIDVKELEQKVIGALKTCYDPEIPCDIYELGLIYSVEGRDRRQGRRPDDADLAARAPSPARCRPRSRPR